MAPMGMGLWANTEEEMDIPTITADRRDTVGTKAMRALRADGRIPGVMYGRKQDNVNLTLDAITIHKIVDEASLVVELDIAGEKTHVLLRGIERDHLGDQIQHVDFLRIDLADKVRVSVPLTFVGTAKGATRGGLLQIQKGLIPTNCPANAIPKGIEIEVTNLDIGDSLYFKDVPLPDGAELIANPKGIVVQCVQARRAAALAKAEEVRGKGPAKDAAPAEAAK